jgi:hypothetical protein
MTNKNPFANIPVPVKLDPRKMAISDYIKYTSYEMDKFQSSLRTYKKSLFYMGGTLALSLLGIWYANRLAHSNLFGSDCTCFIIKIVGAIIS